MSKSNTSSSSSSSAPIGISVTGRSVEEGPTVIVYPYPNNIKNSETRLDPDGGFEKYCNTVGSRALARSPSFGQTAMAIDSVTGCIFIADQCSNLKTPFIRVFNANRTFMGIIPPDSIDKGPVRGTAKNHLRITHLTIDSHPNRRILYASTFAVDAQGASTDAVIRIPLHDPLSSSLVTVYNVDKTGSSTKDTDYRSLCVHEGSGDLFTCLAYVTRIFAGDKIEERVITNNTDNSMNHTDRWSRRPNATEANDGCPFPIAGNMKETGTYYQVLADNYRNRIFTLVMKPGVVAVVSRPVRAVADGSGTQPSAVGPSVLWLLLRGVKDDSVSLAMLPVKVPGTNNPDVPLVPCLLARKLETIQIPDEHTGEVSLTYGDPENEITIFAIEPPPPVITNYNQFPPPREIAVFSPRLLFPVSTISEMVYNPVSGDVLVIDRLSRSRENSFYCIRNFEELIPREASLHADTLLDVMDTVNENGIPSTKVSSSSIVMSALHNYIELMNKSNSTTAKTQSNVAQTKVGKK